MNLRTDPALTAWLPVPAAPRERLAGRPQPPGGPAGRHVPRFGIPLALAVLATIGFSLALVPRGQEEALLRLDRGDAAGALAVLEGRHAAGERSPGAIAALARARAETGNLAGAIALLDPLAQEYPEDRDLLEAVVSYRRARPGDRQGLLRALTMLEAVAPATERRREIAGLHGILGDVPAQRAILRDLVARGQGLPHDYLALARIEAAGGAAAEGIAVLRRMERDFPAAMDVHATLLGVSLLVREGRPEEAAAEARDWLSAQSPTVAIEAAPMLASHLGAAGRPELAVLLLRPLAQPGAPIALVLALAQAEIDAQQQAEALRRLEALPPGSGAAALEAASLRLRLALALGEPARAMAALEAMPRGADARGLAPALAAAALDAQQHAVLARLQAWGGPDLLAEEPALAAETALSLGDDGAARRWAALAGDAVPDDPRRALGFAQTLARLGEPDRAVALLAGALARADLPPGLLTEAARRFLEADRAALGAAALADLRRRRPSAAADAGWALAAAAVPAEEQALVAWLAGPNGAEIVPDLLRDVMHVAADAGLTGAALAAADRLAARDDDPAPLRVSARLLLDAGRPVEARTVLAALRARGLPEPALEDAARDAAWRKGDAAAAAELRALWTERLAAAEGAEARRAALAMLVELGADAAALPALAELARADPAAWLWTYVAAAARAGRDAEAAALRAELALRPDLPVEMRRQLAFGLLEAGARRAAEPAFRALAANAPPDSQPVRDLLHLWGRQPGPAGLAWIEARGRAAHGAERAEWMALLNGAGGAARAIAVYRSGNAADQSQGWDAYVAALGATRDRGAIAAAVREALPRETSPERLQALAVLAGAAGDAALEDRALRALVLAGGGDAAVRRRVAFTAWQGGDAAFAERLLAPAARNGSADAETLFVLGEISARRGDAAGAAAYRSAALRRLDPSQPGAQRLQATLLRSLGRKEEALRLYATLLSREPRDTNLRADVAALLIDLGHYERARAVLASR